MVEGLILNGKPANFPNKFEELKAGIFQRVFQEWDMEKELPDRDYFQLFNILSSNGGREFGILADTPENHEAVYQLTRWFIETPCPYTKDLPKEITIDGRVITIPEKIGSLSSGQNIVLRQLLLLNRLDEGGITTALAMYLQPLFDNSKFDYKRAKDIELIVKEMPAEIVYPVGFFLLKRMRRHGLMQQETWHLILTNLKLMLEKMLPSWQTVPGLLSLQAWRLW